jgi:hypothetical protein
MQKFIITAAIDDLIKARAVFETPTDRAAGALNVILSYPDGYRVGFEGTRDPDAGTFVFRTTSEDVMDDVTGDLGSLDIPYKLDSFHGQGLKINVLDLLRTGWLIHAPANQQLLNVALPNGLNVLLKWRNDGTNLYAEFDGIDEDPSLELRRGALAMLHLHLKEAGLNLGVSYEVL